MTLQLWYRCVNRLTYGKKLNELWLKRVVRGNRRRRMGNASSLNLDTVRVHRLFAYVAEECMCL